MHLQLYLRVSTSSTAEKSSTRCRSHEIHTPCFHFNLVLQYPCWCCLAQTGMGAQTSLAQYVSHACLLYKKSLRFCWHLSWCQKLWHGKNFNKTKQIKYNTVLFSWLSVNNLLPEEFLDFFRVESGLSLFRAGGTGWWNLMQMVWNKKIWWEKSSVN